MHPLRSNWEGVDSLNQRDLMRGFAWNADLLCVRRFLHFALDQFVEVGTTRSQFNAAPMFDPLRHGGLDFRRPGCFFAVDSNGCPFVLGHIAGQNGNLACLAFRRDEDRNMEETRWSKLAHLLDMIADPRDLIYIEHGLLFGAQ